MAGSIRNGVGRHCFDMSGEKKKKAERDETVKY